MSRIGMKPVPVASGVKVTVNGKEVVTEGKLGKMSITLPEAISAAVEGNEVKVSRVSDEGNNKALHGLFRSLIKNNIIGVSEGYKKELQIVGVGYKAVLAGNKLTLSLGYSHDIVYPVPEGIKIQITDGTKLQITGIDKQLVGEVAASIRKFKKPEPYKGKGVRYSDEHVVIKPGKTNQ
jgi:large subunit ribosomal protein L6